MRDEQQRQVAAVLLDQAAVVERRHDGLAGAGRRDHEIPVPVVHLSLGVERFEDADLMR